ncbi:hypothetical protein XENOCAPTIV_008785 [Xenoophorus captivus]|uniref:Uncharacterized protein n=1 Tax=Xenoophorus captivus TaxID=1517983 RepID=A0ABV0R0W4_9TELE
MPNEGSPICSGPWRNCSIPGLQMPWSLSDFNMLHYIMSPGSRVFCMHVQMSEQVIFLLGAIDSLQACVNLHLRVTSNQGRSSTELLTFLPTTTFEEVMLRCVSPHCVCLPCGSCCVAVTATV